MSQNSLLAGDTATLADPLSGEVIFPAIVNGFKAAEAIDRALRCADNAKEPYTESIAHECNTDMVWVSRLARAFYQFTGAVYRAGVKFPRPTKLISKTFCGELLYAALANRAFKKLMPFWKEEGIINILTSPLLILDFQFLIVNLKIGITHYSSESQLIPRFFVP